MDLKIKNPPPQTLKQALQLRHTPPPVAQDNTRVAIPPRPRPLNLKDQVETTPEVKKGIATTLEGAGAGLVAGLFTASSPAWLGNTLRKSSEKSATLLTAGVSFGAAASVSILAGAVTANVTTDKSEGASIGAGIGALAGAAILGPTLGLGWKGIALGGATGIFMGAAGGFAGAIAAEKR